MANLMAGKLLEQPVRQRATLSEQHTVQDADEILFAEGQWLEKHLLHSLQQGLDMRWQLLGEVMLQEAVQMRRRPLYFQLLKPAPGFALHNSGGFATCIGLPIVACCLAKRPAACRPDAASPKRFGLTKSSGAAEYALNH